MELLYRSRGRSWAAISGSGALRGAGLYLPELGADPIPRGRRARLRPLLRSRSCRRMPGLASLSGRGRFRFPCQCLAARKGLPRRGARPLFLAPQCPSPPSCPCHGCHLLSPCRVPGTLPTCSRCVLVTALGAGDPLPPSPVHTLESTCPAAMLPWAALCPGHCYCHFRVTAQEWWAKQGGDLQERGQDPGKRSHCSQEVLEQWGPEGVQAALGGGVAVMLPGGSPTTSFPGSEPHAAL